MKLFILFIILLTSFKVSGEELNINSRSHILIENSTNTILSDNNSHEKLPIASLTKIMTIYVLFDFIENNNLSKDTVVPISTNAVSTARRTNSSRSFFEERHTVTIDDIIKSLIIHSGNDAAVAISEFIAGTEYEFVEIMNDYAIKLGMHNTVYSNSSGLPTPRKTQYSTAYDQGILSYRLINDFKELYDIYFHQRNYTHNNIFQQSRNRLLFIDPQFDGIKTGWTRESGYSYSTSIYKNGRRLIIVTINAEKPDYRFQDAIKLSNYGFDNYSNLIIAEKNKPIKGIEKLPLFRSNYLFAEIQNSDDVIITLHNELIDKVSAEIFIPEKLIAPVYKGQKIGLLKLFIEDELVQESNIQSSYNYPIGNIKSYLIDSFLIRK